MWVYFMYFNMTLAPSNVYTSIDKPMNKDMKLLALKLAVDNSIIEYKAKLKGLDYIPKIEQQVQPFPYVPDRVFKDLDVVAMYGAFYLIFVPLTAFMIVFDEMMREKSDNLRLGMQVLGTQNAAYWTSWVITGTFINAFMTIELIFIGKWYQFDVFHRTPGYAFFLMMAGPGQAYISMAMLFSTLAKTRAQSFTINFCVIMISMVMCIVLQEPTILKKVFFNQNMPPWVVLMVKLFYLMPALQFVKMLMDLTTIACFHFDPMNLNWVASQRHFEYADMFVRQTGQFFTNDKYEVDSMIETLWSLAYLMAAHAVLTWYFDNTIPANRGVVQPWNFFLLPSYWLPSVFGESTSEQEQDAVQMLKQMTGLSEETKEILKLEAAGKTQNVNGIRCLGLSKSFKSIIEGKEIKALRNVYF